MKVYRDINALPAFTKAVVTIGTFDGVHRGHVKILEQLKSVAAQIGGETVLITFDPHPRQVLKPDDPPLRLINTVTEKTELLEAAGLDHLVIYPFNTDFSRLSAQGYIEDFLIKCFHPHTLIIGYDHHFGAGRSGNYQLLETYRDRGCFQLLEIQEQLIQGIAVSSTRIRNALQSGAIREANQLLGYPFFFEGRVIPGNQMGRTIGYKTANLKLPEEAKMLPAQGVYAVRARIARPESNSFKAVPLLNGMMNIGIRPTVGGTLPVTEVHLFDFDQAIYGQQMRVEVHEYIRQEKRFEGIEALKAQLDKDAEACRNWLENHK